MGEMTKPYRPSNGTEGEFFKDAFCHRCRRNDFDPETGQGDCCDIEVRTMIYDIDEPGYPTEWIRGADGPTCTAFEEKT